MRNTLILAGFLSLLAGLAPGQSATQAVLTGRVVDRDGRPLPGVTVTARTSSVGMGERGAVTGADGRYRIAPLPPAADYTVVAALPGHASVEIGPVDLDPGKTTSLHFTLYPTSNATERVTVTGKGDIVDLASTRTSTVFNSEFLEGLPILGRTYQDVLTLAPGVTDVDGDGNPNVHGARDTDFQTRVDGANATDPFSGFFGQNLNLESIAEIEVIGTGASAEFSQAQGGFANIVTKSGGNELEGSFKTFFRSDLFDNDGANNNDISDRDLFGGLDGFQDLRPFLTLGGPILRDRLWYFLALEWLSLEEPVNTLTRPALFTEDGWNNFAKITWQVDPAHRLSFSVVHDPREFTGFGLNTRSAPESDFRFERGGYSGTVKWSWNLSPNLLLETLVSRFDTSFVVEPVTESAGCILDELGRCDPFLDDVQTIDLRLGTTTGPYFQTSEDDRLRDMFRSDLSLYVDGAGGSHSIKTGFELAAEEFADRVRTDTVRFDDFIVCVPLPEGFNDPADPDFIPPGSSAFGTFCNPGDFDIPDDTGAGDEPITVGSINFQESVPGDLRREADKDSLGLYVQDSFRPLPNLAVNVGLRYDREEASALGFELFDPREEAREFVKLAALASGQDPDEISHASFFLDPVLLFDLNGDGLDPLHCRPYDLDGLAFGDGMPDGRSDDFFTYIDGNSDGVADPDDPDDIVLPFGDGLADGQNVHPECDRLSDDTFFLVSTFRRHQFDDVASPFTTLVNIDPDRGLPGKLREPDDFTLTNDNLAPRLSVSWDPWGDNKTKLFATWGRYYDRLFLATLVPEEGPDPRTEAFFASDRVSGADAIQAQVGRFSITQVDRELRTPFTDELTLGIERELAPEWVLGLTYIRRKARDQLQDVDFNHFAQDLNGDGELDDTFGLIRVTTGGDGVDPTVCFGDNPPPARECFFATTSDGQPDLVAWNPFFNQVLRVGNFNESDYEAYQLVLTRRLSRRWQMTASYVYSEAVGDAESFLSDLGNDPGTVDDEEGPLSFDQTHVLKFSAVTYLPLDQAVGTRVQWGTGTPYSTVLRRDSADFFGSFFFRTTFPTAQRNDQRNEPFWNLDAYYKKTFGLWGVDGAVGLEVINLLQSDDLVIDSVEPTQVLGLDATRRFGRRWQLSLELHF